MNYSIQRRRFGAPSVALLAFALTAITLAGLPARAQSGGPYDLTWSTIDGGGATAVTGGVYALGGTAGQPDAAIMTGGVYTLQGGFWFSGIVASSVDEEPVPGANGVPLVNRLYDAAPNPFNPRTWIAFDLAQPGPARLAVYDLRGSLVRTLVAETLPAGRHVRIWDGIADDGAPAASGMYILAIDAGDFHERRKGVLLK
jgi:hypothetical protein